MTIKIPDNLPAKQVLENEGIFVITENRAMHQDIRPLQIAILNLMPTKIQTETQLLRLIGNTPLQVELTLLHPKTYKSQNTSLEHLTNFYNTFDEVRDRAFDGLIITGAPVEKMQFEEVAYWQELTTILEWSKTNVYSTLHICWGAQAGLYYHYKVPKFSLPKKVSGVFAHNVINKNATLLRGFDDIFCAPHSRYTEVRREDINKVLELDILSESDEAGIYIVKNKDGRQIFVTGHSEYDPFTLKDEYERDIGKGIDIEVPKNYFRHDNPDNPPCVSWRGHANLLFSNWLNYYVYQETPYDLNTLRHKY